MASQDWMTKDFYAVLGVSKDADAAAVAKEAAVKAAADDAEKRKAAAPPATAAQPYSSIVRIVPRPQKKPFQQAENCCRENSPSPTALPPLSKIPKATESVCTAHVNPTLQIAINFSHYSYKNLT